MNLFDSHAHLTSPDVFAHLEAIVKRAEAAHVKWIVNICTDPLSLQRGIALQKNHPWILNAGATPPHDVEKEGESSFDDFAVAARSNQLVAIGETGLEYHYAHSSKAVQQQFLIRYLHLASECQLPVIIHCREAFDDLFAIADREYPQKPAILHCFTGSLEDAKRGLERGWLISFSGILTFKKSEPLRHVARWVPLESLLIETDTPYLAPESKRGRPNEPSFVGETAACLAALKGVSLEEIARITAENAQRIFKFL